MGLGSWLAETLMSTAKKVEEVIDFAGEVIGDPVEGVGTVVSDITDAIGLDGTAEVIKDATKIAGDTIKGAAKIAGATNTAITRGGIGVIGELADDDELIGISIDNEPDSDVFDEIEKIFDNGADFIDKYSGATEFQKLQQMYHRDYTKTTY